MVLTRAARLCVFTTSSDKVDVLDKQLRVVAPASTNDLPRLHKTGGAEWRGRGGGGWTGLRLFESLRSTRDKGRGTHRVDGGGPEVVFSFSIEKVAD